MWRGRAAGQADGVQAGLCPAPSPGRVPACLPSTSPDRQVHGKVQDGGGLALPPGPALSNPLSPHGSPCGSLQVQGALTPQISPLRSLCQPSTRGTDRQTGRQAAIPCGYGRHHAHDNTGSTSTAASPPCIKWVLGKQLLRPAPSPQHHPNAPFMHPLPVSLPTPGHRGQIQPLLSAMWAQAPAACSAHPQRLSASPPQHQAPLPASTGHSPARGSLAAGHDRHSSEMG